MERKSNNTGTVTTEQVTTGLSSAPVTQREEQALRMRYGASVGLKQPLPQAHNGNEELSDELLLIEMQLLRGVKARAAAKAGVTATTATVAATKSAVKSKIAAKLSKK